MSWSVVEEGVNLFECKCLLGLFIFLLTIQVAPAVGQRGTRDSLAMDGTENLDIENLSGRVSELYDRVNTRVLSSRSDKLFA